MYLSCLKVDVHDRGGLPTVGAKWLQNRYRVHQRLCMAFPRASRLQADPDFLQAFDPSDFPLLRAAAVQTKRAAGTEQLAQVHAPRSSSAGFLFRVDPSRTGTQIIVQSASAPNWAYAFGNFHGVLLEDAAVRPFAPAFGAGQRLQFRLEANPTRRVDTKSAPDGTRRHGRRVPVAASRCVDWLRRFERDGGFILDPQDVRLDCGVVRARKSAESEEGVSYSAARFEGLLTVADPNAFARKLSAGFGTAKAYGFGLMSVVPALT
jgi:CRISPR system Cascade subunit CasE